MLQLDMTEQLNNKKEGMGREGCGEGMGREGCGEGSTLISLQKC